MFLATFKLSHPFPPASVSVLVMLPSLGYIAFFLCLLPTLLLTSVTPPHSLVFCSQKSLLSLFWLLTFILSDFNKWIDPSKAPASQFLDFSIIHSHLPFAPSVTCFMVTRRIFTSFKNEPFQVERSNFLLHSCAVY